MKLTSFAGQITIGARVVGVAFNQGDYKGTFAIDSLTLAEAQMLADKLPGLLSPVADTSRDTTIFVSLRTELSGIQMLNPMERYEWMGRIRDAAGLYDSERETLAKEVQQITKSFHDKLRYQLTYFIKDRDTVGISQQEADQWMTRLEAARMQQFHGFGPSGLTAAEYQALKDIVEEYLDRGTQYSASFQTPRETIKPTLPIEPPPVVAAPAPTIADTTPEPAVSTDVLPGLDELASTIANTASPEVIEKRRATSKARLEAVTTPLEERTSPSIWAAPTAADTLRQDLEEEAEAAEDARDSVVPTTVQCEDCKQFFPEADILIEAAFPFASRCAPCAEKEAAHKASVAAALATPPAEPAGWNTTLTQGEPLTLEVDSSARPTEITSGTVAFTTTGQPDNPVIAEFNRDIEQLHAPQPKEVQAEVLAKTMATPEEGLEAAIDTAKKLEASLLRPQTPANHLSIAAPLAPAQPRPRAGGTCEVCKDTFNDAKSLMTHSCVVKQAAEFVIAATSPEPHKVYPPEAPTNEFSRELYMDIHNQIMAKAEHTLAEASAIKKQIMAQRTATAFGDAEAFALTKLLGERTQSVVGGTTEAPPKRSHHKKPAVAGEAEKPRRGRPPTLKQPTVTANGTNGQQPHPATAALSQAMQDQKQARAIHSGPAPIAPSAIETVVVAFAGGAVQGAVSEVPPVAAVMPRMPEPKSATPGGVDDLVLTAKTVREAVHRLLDFEVPRETILSHLQRLAPQSDMLRKVTDMATRVQVAIDIYE